MISGPATTHRPMPWRVGDLLILYVLNLVGLTLVIAGWFQTSGAVTLRAQIPWVNVATTGIIVAGAGNVVWLLAGRRCTGELRRDVARRLPRTQPVAAGRVPNERVEPIPAANDGVPTLVSAPGMTRFHRPGCILVSGKEVASATPRQHERRGRRPCGVCRSGEPL